MRAGKIVELKARAMPLGLMPEQAYHEQEVSLAPDDCVLFYTDGLVEAHNAQRQMFESHRLKWRLYAHAAADGLIEYLLNDLAEFAGPGSEEQDVVTLVLLRKIG